MQPTQELRRLHAFVVHGYCFANRSFHDGNAPTNGSVFLSRAGNQSLVANGQLPPVGASAFQAGPFTRRLRRVVSVGRVKWEPGSKHTGKDNCAWHLFTRPAAMPAAFYGRGQRPEQRVRLRAVA